MELVWPQSVRWRRLEGVECTGHRIFCLKQNQLFCDLTYRIHLNGNDYDVLLIFEVSNLIIIQMSLTVRSVKVFYHTNKYKK